MFLSLVVTWARTWSVLCQSTELTMLTAAGRPAWSVMTSPDTELPTPSTAMSPEHGYTHLDDVRETAMPPTSVDEVSDVTATTARHDAPKSGERTDVIACKYKHTSAAFTARCVCVARTLLSRDACLFVCLFVRPSHAATVSKRLNVSTNFIHFQVAYVNLQIWNSVTVA